MKNIIVILTLCFSGAAMAELVLVPQCFGSSYVSQDEPFILNFSDLQSPRKQRLLAELTNTGMVIVTDVRDYDTDHVVLFSVEVLRINGLRSSGIKNRRVANSIVNRSVTEKVRNTFRKFGAKYHLECNILNSSN